MSNECKLYLILFFSVSRPASVALSVDLPAVSQQSLKQRERGRQREREREHTHTHTL